MGVTNELKQTLKQLRLSGLLATLMDRVAYAKGTKLSYPEFLELVLNDEIQRRQNSSLSRRLKNAAVDIDQTFERFDWDAAITVDRDKLKDLLSLEFIGHHENILICGPVGVGKTFIANAVAHSACRRGHTVLMLRAATMFKKLLQSRADNSYEREVVKLISPDLLIIDDFGLQRLSEEQAGDFYEIVIERYGRASTLSPATAICMSGWPCSMIRSWRTRPSIALLITLIILSSKEKVIGEKKPLKSDAKRTV